MAWIPRDSIIWWIGPILSFGGIILLGITYLRWRSQWYVLTTEEVYQKSGLLSTNVVQIRLERIQNTTFSQSFIEKLLSHGDVTIYTSGSSTIDLVLKNIPEPQTVNRLLTEQLDQVNTQS
ncbi:PH domain-containing protein [Haladaptatus sp. CMAA 1911]|uniref:PH domain-containing protein n=1 Tax=unclassified Haladaptatus TaxID=2622732 RepID=UPI003753F586